MKENIRYEILEKARILFNNRGYNAVSMRAIASQCNISVGNLTYYFPHKLDILCSLMQDINPVKNVTEITSLEDLATYLDEMITGVKKNNFFFNVSDMQRIDEICFEINKKSVETLQNNLILTLKNLQNHGLLIKNVSNEIWNTIISFWMLSHISWVREDFDSSVYKNTTQEEFLFQHFVLLLPYMTEKGYQQLEQLKKKRSPK